MRLRNQDITIIIMQNFWHFLHIYSNYLCTPSIKRKPIKCDSISLLSTYLLTYLSTLSSYLHVKLISPISITRPSLHRRSFIHSLHAAWNVQRWWIRHVGTPKRCSIIRRGENNNNTSRNLVSTDIFYYYYKRASPEQENILGQVLASSTARRRCDEWMLTISGCVFPHPAQSSISVSVSLSLWLSSLQQFRWKMKTSHGRFTGIRPFYRGFSIKYTHQWAPGKGLWWRRRQQIPSIK